MIRIIINKWWPSPLMISIEICCWQNWKLSKKESVSLSLRQQIPKKVSREILWTEKEEILYVPWRKHPCSSVKGLARACPPMITLVGQVARPPAATAHQHAAQPFQSPQRRLEKYISDNLRNTFLNPRKCRVSSVRNKIQKSIYISATSRFQ